jgi:two-component system phosphate regulon sensor histidine kinase PhoR
MTYNYFMSKKPSTDSRSKRNPGLENSGNGDSNSKPRGGNQAGSSDIYQTLIENLNEVVFSIDLQGTFTFISPVIEQLSGYKVEQVVGKTFDTFVYPEDLPGVKSSFKHTMTGHPEPYEFRAFDRNHVIHNVHTSSHLIQENGKPIGITGVMLEITDRKTTEQALLDSETKYHTLVEQIPAAVYTDSIDEMSTTLYMSPQITRLSGYTPEE